MPTYSLEQDQNVHERDVKPISGPSQTGCTVSLKACDSRDVDQPRGWEAYKTDAKRFYMSVGMSENALEGYAMMHVDPVTGLRYFWVCQVGLMAALLVGFAGMTFDGSRIFYILTIPYCGVYTLQLTATMCFWRFGPDFAHHKVLQSIMGALSLCLLPMLYFGYLGPIETVPWNDRLVFSFVTLLMFLFASQAGQAGANMGEHPLEPRTSIIAPVVQGTINTILLWDALTDIGIIRSLLQQARLHASILH